ncbi:MAG: hypothetical protein ABIQ35_04515 [Verrucomicrobiota bacterium]
MANEFPLETETSPDGARIPKKVISVLAARSPLLASWDWKRISELNQIECAKRRSQFGYNSETSGRVKDDWGASNRRDLTLPEAFNLLRSCNRLAPFHFSNETTFAEIARLVTEMSLADLPRTRRRAAGLLGVDYVSRDLDQKTLILELEALTGPLKFEPGDRVRTFKGSMHGTILGLFPDGRLAWLTDSGAELVSSPEALLIEGRK